MIKKRLPAKSLVIAWLCYSLAVLAYLAYQAGKEGVFCMSRI